MTLTHGQISNKAHDKFLLAQRVYRLVNTAQFKNKLDGLDTDTLAAISNAVDALDLDLINKLSTRSRNHNALSFIELRTIAKSKRIKNWHTMRKVELIAALKGKEHVGTVGYDADATTKGGHPTS